MSKKSAGRNIPVFLGMGLILLGIVWTCAKASRPGELNAAPGPIRTAQRINARGTPAPQSAAPLEEDTLLPSLEVNEEPFLAQAAPASLDESGIFPAGDPIAEPEEPTLDSEPPAFDSAANITQVEIPPQNSPGTQNNLGTMPGPAASPHPGNVETEGIQNAQLAVVKEIPSEVSFGAETLYRIHIKNTGNAVAHGVTLRDAVPEGARLIEYQPPAAPSAAGEVVWPAFDMQPNEERVFECRFVPETEGVIGSSATVTFASEASGKTTCTRPQLHLAARGPAHTMIGETVKLDIEITNVGTGTARGVTLLENVPEWLSHPSGRMLNNVIGDIKPGEKKELALSLKAVSPGAITNVLSVSTESGLYEEASTDLFVNAPELSLEISGSKQRYLQREAVYRLKVWNPGSAPAKGVKLTAKLPEQMQFVRTNNEGLYQESDRTVHWELVELPEKTAPGEIELVLNPVSIGTGRLVFSGVDNMQLSAATEQEITVDGMTALNYQIQTVNSTVEQGGDALFEIILSNKGTKEASGVEMTVTLPPGMEAVNMEGPTRYTARGNTLVFAPISKIGPQEETIYKLKFRCNTQGDQRLTVQVGAEGIEPLTKEESVRVY